MRPDEGGTYRRRPPLATTLRRSDIVGIESARDVGERSTGRVVTADPRNNLRGRDPTCDRLARDAVPVQGRPPLASGGVNLVRAEGRVAPITTRTGTGSESCDGAIVRRRSS